MTLGVLTVLLAMAAAYLSFCWWQSNPPGEPVRLWRFFLATLPASACVSALADTWPAHLTAAARFAAVALYHDHDMPGWYITLVAALAMYGIGASFTAGDATPDSAIGSALVITVLGLLCTYVEPTRTWWARALTTLNSRQP